MFSCKGMAKEDNLQKNIKNRNKKKKTGVQRLILPKIQDNVIKIIGQDEVSEKN